MVTDFRIIENRFSSTPSYSSLLCFHIEARKQNIVYSTIWEESSVLIEDFTCRFEIFIYRLLNYSKFNFSLGTKL